MLGLRTIDAAADWFPAGGALPSEAARLGALQSYDVLDSGSDPRVDAVTRAAAALFGAPIAAVSIMDGDRQWAKSVIGSDTRQTPRGLAFSPYLLGMPGNVMVVEDASRDARFAGIPLVAGPDGVRFYAGAKLMDRAGHLLGTLCVMDRKPGTATPAQLDQLTDLAAAAMTALDLHRTESALLRNATHDALTGLPNRATLHARAAEMIAQPAAPGCAMVTIDLGRFSQVMNLAGHAGGEALLRQAGERLLASLGARETAGRLSGDEFGVLLPASADGKEAQAVADELMDLLSRPFVIDGVPISVNPSIGIASCPADAATAEDLMRRSADALYWAKRRGRNRIYNFDLGLHRKLVGRNLLERDLRAALAGDAFFLHWQPFVSARTGRCLGFEALLRWNRPGHGPVPPAEIMAVAETCHLAGAIDRWVLDAACRSAAAWPADRVLSVNLSASCFERDDLAAMTARALRTSGLAASRLQLEIGSRAFAAPDVDAFAQAVGLRGLGVSLVLNDFGAGCSMLGQLKGLPFDKIKLNRALLDGIGGDPRAAAIARAALQLGHALGATLCATGLETAAEYAFLVEHGCDEVQGAYVCASGPLATDLGSHWGAGASGPYADEGEEPFRAVTGIVASFAVSAGLWAVIVQVARMLLR